MGQDVYAITNLEGYASEMRQSAANSLSPDNEDDLDDYISINQMVNLVKSECIGFDDYDRPLLNEEANEKIYESVVTWIHNIGLARLAAQNLVECAWDDELNEMVFWANPSINSTNKKKSNAKRRSKKKDTGS